MVYQTTPSLAVLGTAVLMSLAFLPVAIARVTYTSKPAGNSDDRVATLFQRFRQGDRPDGWKFPELDFEDIPALIKRLGNQNRLKSFPRNPLSSQYESECPEGMVAAWLIEGIRKSDPATFPSLNALCLSRKPRDQDWTKQSEGHQIAVAKAYRNWWGRAQRLPRQQARALDPLAGTPLRWY